MRLGAHANIDIAIDKNTQQMAVAVDGAPRYIWPVSTGRPGYDTPNGTFKVNRMDADHLSQEWDNAPMPHTMFFDLRGHAIHGFFDVKHLGLPVSHGCVRLSPAHATVLFNLVKAEGMSHTTVVVSGETPAAARRWRGRARRSARRGTADADRAGLRPAAATGSYMTGSRSPITRSSPIMASRSAYYGGQQSYLPPQPPPVISVFRPYPPPGQY